MNENIIHALGMMGQGMLGIFVVLGLIAGLVALMQKFENRKKQQMCRAHLSGPGTLYFQSSITSSRLTGPTRLSTKRVISSSMRTGLVVMDGTEAESPSSSSIRTP